MHVGMKYFTTIFQMCGMHESKELIETWIIGQIAWN